jgi:hypothetical protein
VLPSSQVSSGSWVPFPQVRPVRESVAVHVALHRVQVAVPYGHSVSVTVLPSSQASSGSLMPFPHVRPVRESVALHVASHRVQVAVPYGHSVSVTALPSSQVSPAPTTPSPHSGAWQVFEVALQVRLGSQSAVAAHPTSAVQV